MTFRYSLVVMVILGVLLGGTGVSHAQRFTISGYDTLTFRMNSVRGSTAGQQAFTYGNYERQNAFENNAGLNITGEVFPRVSLNATINSSRFSPDRSRYNLEYKGNGLGITVGDINAALTNNEFASFQRSLRGINVTSQIGSVNLNTLLSEERAQVATDVFPGTNSPGPYSLRYSPIMDGSEQVRVDGNRKSLGVDYTLDYNTGILTFQQGMIIPSTSTIEVSYEYAGYGSNPGILAGLRGEVPIGKLGKMGATFINQSSKAGGPSQDSNLRRDLFIGDNTPMILALNYRPVKRIVQVTVDGVPQLVGVDYEIQNLDIGIIRFLKVVPQPPGAVLGEAAANVVVEYELQDTAPGTSVGDRAILGLDSTLNLGRHSTLGIQFAHSSGDPTRTGNALSMRANSVLGKFTLGLNYRDVGKQFAAIESVGFQQKERAIDGNILYRASEYLQATAHIISSQRPTVSMLGNSTTDDVLNALQSSFSVRANYPNFPDIEVGHQRFRTTGGSLNNVTAMSNLALRYALPNNLTLSANLDNNAVTDWANHGSTTNSFTQRYSASYSPGARLSLQADFTNSNLNSRTAASTGTEATADTETAVQFNTINNRATSASLTTSYSPIDMATITASYRTSDSGAGAYGATTGTPIFPSGYYSSAYTSGSYLSSNNYSFGNQYTGSYYNPIAPDLGTNPGATDNTRMRTTTRAVGLQLRPMDRLNIGLNYENSLQEGQITSSNSVSNNTGCTITYSPMETLTLNSQLSRQRYHFLGAGGNSSSNIAFLGAQMGPFHRFTLNLNYQSMTSDTATSNALTGTPDSTSMVEYSTKLNTLTGRLEYPLSQTRKVFTELQYSTMAGGGTVGTTTSPEDSTRVSAGLGLEFALNHYLSWTMNVQRIRYNDRNNPDRNYNGNLATGEMRARF